MGNYSNVEYFSIKQDREIINAGGFFCHACLASKPATEASPDPRYCQVCYDFLTKEAEMLPENKHPKWIPKPQRALKACEKQYPIHTGRWWNYVHSGEQKGWWQERA